MLMIHVDFILFQITINRDILIMDYCTTIEEFVDTNSNGSQKMDISTPKASSPPEYEFIDTPRYPVYGFPPRGLQRGHYPRRRRTRVMQFNRCSPHFSRHIHPRNCYDVYPECCPEQRSCSGHKKGKCSGIMNPQLSNFWGDCIDDFNYCDYPARFSEWRMDRCKDSQRMCKNFSVFDIPDACDKHASCGDKLTPSKNCLATVEGIFITKGNSSSRNGKRQSNGDLSSDFGVPHEMSDMDTIEAGSSFLPTSEYHFLSNGISYNLPTEYLNMSDSSGVGSADPNLNETAFSVQNTPSDYFQNSLNTDQSIVPVNGNHTTGAILSSVDEQGTLNFGSGNTPDDYLLLENLILELENANNLKNVAENVSANDLQPQNGQLVTFPESESGGSENNLKLSDNQFESLIQQNQVLTDLLSKVINKSEIFNSSNGNEIQFESTNSEICSEQNANQKDQENAEQKNFQSINSNALSSNTIVPITKHKSYSTLQERNEKEHENPENNVAEFNSCQNNSNDEYKNKMKSDNALSENGYSCLDFIHHDNGGLSNGETNLDSKNTDIKITSEIVEETTENVLQLSDEINLQNNNKIKTVVRKATVRRRTLSKSKELPKQYCQEDKNKLIQNCDPRFKITCDAQTQTMDLEIFYQEPNHEPHICNNLKSRKLRSNVKNRVRKQSKQCLVENSLLLSTAHNGGWPCVNLIRDQSMGEQFLDIPKEIDAYAKNQKRKPKSGTKGANKKKMKLM